MKKLMFFLRISIAVSQLFEYDYGLVGYWGNKFKESNERLEKSHQEWKNDMDKKMEKMEQEDRHNEMMRKLDSMNNNLYMPSTPSNDSSYYQYVEQKNKRYEQEQQVKLKRYRQIYETSTKEKQLDECVKNWTKLKGSTKPCLDYMNLR